MSRIECPVDELELSALLDGELTENRAGRLREHLEGCPACATRLARLQALITQLKAPVPEASDPAFVDAVESRLPAADGLPPARRARRAPVLLALSTLAAAAVIALFLIPAWPTRDVFRPRGPSAPWHALVTTSLVAVANRPGVPPAQPLAPGVRLLPGDGIAVNARNGNAGTPVYLMVFAVDAKQEVHWIVPTWSDARENPTSVLLPAGGSLPGPAGRTPEDPAPGKMRVMTLLSRSALDVRTIEGDLGAGRRLEGEDRQLRTVDLEMSAR